MQGDVFGLNRLYELQVLNSMGTETIQSSTIDYGYFGGGYTPIIINTFSRLDLSTEVASSLPAQLPIATRSLTALSSSSYGYYAGGVTPTPAVVCTISRLDFSNDSISSPGSYQLTEARQRLASVSSTNYGYFGGGANAATTIVNTVDRIDFSTETVAARTNDLTQARIRLVAVPSTNYGYFNGGEITGPSNVCTIDRIDFTTETTSVAVNYSRVLRRGHGQTFSDSYGYFAGGQSPVPVYLNTMDRLDFSTEVTSSPGKNLVQSKSSTDGVSGSFYGYFVSGFTPTVSTSVERLEFSTETVTNLSGAKLPSGRGDFGSVTGSRSLNLTRNYFSESASYGYFYAGAVGGTTPTDNRSTVDRIDYSNETTSAPGKSVSFASRGANAVSTNSYAYIFLDNLNIDRLDYSSDSITTITSKFRDGGYLGATSQTNSYGYITGNTANFSRVDRLDFSTEVYSSPGKKLFTGRRSHFGDVYNSSYGYFGGGTVTPAGGPFFSSIERLDFSTEIVTQLNQSITDSTSVATSSNLYGYITDGTPPSWTNKLDFSTESIQSIRPTIVSRGTGTSTNSFGYFVSGLLPTGAGNSSNIIRLNFSDDTTSTLTSKLPLARFYHGASSGGQSQRVLAGRTVGTYGYFGGGDIAGVQVATIARTDFSTETVSAPGNQLSQPRFRLAAVSNNSYGYFGAGFAPLGPTAVCTVDRLDFTTGVISNPGVNITRARGSLSANSSNSYGYFVGGGPVSGCILDRIDFSNETSAITLNNVVQRLGSGSVTNSNYGYFGAGSAPAPFYSSISRLDYYTETYENISEKLSDSKQYLAGASSASYGYFGGGLTVAPTILNTIDRIDFSTETISQPGKNLTQARSGLAAVSSNSYGYFGGGNAPTVVCTIDRLDFFTDTVSLSKSQLTEAKSDFTSVSTEQRASTVNKGFSSFTATYGYFMGGQIITPGVPTPTVTRTDTVDKIDFSSETVTVSNVLPGGRARYATMSNSNYGYLLCGQFGSSPTNPETCTLDRLDFSSDTFSTPNRYPTSLGMNHNTAVSSSNYGYSNHGVQSLPPTLQPTVIKLDFSNESMVALPKSTFPIVIRARGNASSSSYGYFVGGTIPPGNPDYTTIDRLDFSTETISQPGKNLTVVRNDFACFSSYSYAYFSGGNSNTNTDRLDFSTEIISTINPGDRASLQGPFGTNSSNFGYYTPSPGVTCLLSRLNFSTETTSATTPLSQGRNFGNAVTSTYKSPIRNGWGWRKTYGYFAGQEAPGSPPLLSSAVDRLDFSTETVSTPGKNLTQARGRLAAVSSSSYGYFGGGYTTLPANTVDKLDFSTDIISAPGKNLTQSRQSLSAVSSISYGYFMGGGTNAINSVCTIDRLDFSTDTIFAPGKNLTISRNSHSGIFNASYGYIGGGVSDSISPSLVCIIDRLEFSTETVSSPAVSPGKMSESRYQLGSVSSGSYGYFAGGRNNVPNPSSTIERLDFSNEIISSPGKALPSTKIQLAGTSSGSYGYFGGGNVPGTSTIDRIDFYTESTSRIPTFLVFSRNSLSGIQAN